MRGDIKVINVLLLGLLHDSQIFFPLHFKISIIGGLKYKINYCAKQFLTSSAFITDKNNIMKKLLIITTILLLVISCNKNQQAVKKLDGTWKATSLTESNGIETLDLIAEGLEYEMTFNGCKLKDNEYCSITTIITDDVESQTAIGLYRVTDDGETLEFKETEDSESTDKFIIEELTKSEFTFKLIDDGLVSTITLEKQ